MQDKNQVVIKSLDVQVQGGTSPPGPPSLDPPLEPDVRLNNCKLKLHTHADCLGVFIYKVLSWNKQINIIFSKLYTPNGRLSKLHHVAPLLFQFLFALIARLSSLVVLKKINVDRINKLQKRCIRILTSPDFNLHTNGLYARLKLLLLTF